MPSPNAGVRLVMFGSRMVASRMLCPIEFSLEATVPCAQAHCIAGRSKSEGRKLYMCELKVQDGIWHKSNQTFHPEGPQVPQA